MLYRFRIVHPKVGRPIYVTLSRIQPKQAKKSEKQVCYAGLLYKFHLMIKEHYSNIQITRFKLQGKLV